MPDRYRVKRYKTTLTIPIGTNTVSSAAIPDVSINGLLRGVIVVVGAVDTALVSLSNSATMTENINLTQAYTIKISTTISHTESIGAAEV